MPHTLADIVGSDRPDFSLAPMTVAWETTLACPLSCQHCRATAQHKRDRKELSTLEGLDLIATAADMGTKVFVITGGDPLARDDIYQLIAAVEKSGMHCGFSPSATPRLTTEAINRAVDMGARTVHLSLDGATAETHDAFRGFSGTFDRTLRAMDDVAATSARLQVGTTVARSTRDCLVDMIPLLTGRVDLWSLFFLVATGRAQPEDVLSPQENEEVLRWFAHLDLPFASRTIEAPAYRRVRAQAGLDVKPGVTDGNGFCFVSHIGDVAPSGFLPVVAGNIRKTPLDRLYRESPLFLRLRDPDQLQGKCGRCDFKGICGGSRSSAWTATGDPLGADPSCAYQPVSALS